jgi:hypothetical protein
MVLVNLNVGLGYESPPVSVIWEVDHFSERTLGHSPGISLAGPTLRGSHIVKLKLTWIGTITYDAYANA